MKTIFSSFILLLFITSVFGQTNVPEMSVDTVIVYDPTTEKETTHIVKFNDKRKGLPLDFKKHKYAGKDTQEGQIDTIITFDPKTFEESMMIIEWKSKPVLQPDGTFLYMLEPDTLKSN